MTQILHPTLRAAYDADWYTPWKPPASITRSAAYKEAKAAGWAEWIQTPLDWAAVKDGYVFDLSRDFDGRPIYWHGGTWWQWTKGKKPRLVALDPDNEEEYVAHCGRGDHCARFIERFIRHTKEPLVDQPYILLTWHALFVHTVFGWVDKLTRYRRYTKAYVAIPKKNVKSEFCSALVIYGLRADGEMKAYVYGAACDRKQARLVFDESRDMVKASPQLADEIAIVDSAARLVHLESGSYYLVLSSDAHRSDGLDAHLVIVDELHQHPNRKLFATLARAGRGRRQPLNITVTTYGSTLKGIWGEEHLKAKRILDGSSKDYQTYVIIASAEPIKVTLTAAAKAKARKLKVQRLEQPIDAGTVMEFASVGAAGDSSTITKAIVAAPARRFSDEIAVKPLAAAIPRFAETTTNKDWDSDHAIRRSNPAVDVVFPLRVIRKDIEDNRHTPAGVADVKRLSLNIIAGSADKWLSTAAWQACGTKTFKVSELRDRRCYGGLDLSFSNDLTAFWLAFPMWPEEAEYLKVKNPMVALLGIVWVPGHGIEQREEIEEVPYRAYAEVEQFDGLPLCRICDSPTIDYPQVGEDIVKFCEAFRTQAIAYDARYASFLVEPFLEKAGLQCIRHQQGSISMGPPTKLFEQLVKNQQLAHGNHPILDVAAEGAVLHRPDKVGNRYPAKDKSTTRIDPLISGVMATGWACFPPNIEVDVTKMAYSGKPGTGMWE